MRNGCMDILDNFIAAAKRSVAAGYYDIPSADESLNIRKASLLNTLEQNDFSLITEIKHASPAGEYSFDNIDVAKAAGAFRDCGADAISVVVEREIFKGNIGNIAVAKTAGLPVLFKDFIFTERQVLAAKNSGADAMLLVVKVLERTGADAKALISCAHGAGLEVLLECYDDRELAIAQETEADMLGINNRDLMTLKVDLTRTKRIMDAFPDLDRPLISESGIKTGGDAKYAKSCGASAVLVGTAIWKAQDMQAKIRELKGGCS
jgi:indole-3-glycerol phosphate synthase